MKPALKIEAWGTTTCADLSSTEFAVKKSFSRIRHQQEDLPNTAFLP
jgi:hypothetical protein